MLISNSFRAQDIHIHEDLLSSMPSALSRKRERKPNSEIQKDKQDTSGYPNCIFCHPEVKRKKNPVGSTLEVRIPGKVATLLNDFPYLPYDHRLYFLWSDDVTEKEQVCHKFKIDDFGRIELYWLMLACRDDAKKFKSPIETANRVRLIVGFNIGDLAGQSVPHFHLQSGWEIVLNPREFTHQQLQLFFNEIHAEDLVIFENDKYSLIAPWTPAGKYAVDLYFRGKYVIGELNQNDTTVQL